MYKRQIVDHINSTPRESLGGRTPYDVALENYGIDILKALQLRPIPPDEVNLTPKLIQMCIRDRDMYPDLSNTVISACSFSLRILAAAVAPPATPPTIITFILFFHLS